jgi:hypothetical protein
VDRELELISPLAASIEKDGLVFKELAFIVPLITTSYEPRVISAFPLASGRRGTLKSGVAGHKRPRTPSQSTCVI